MFLDYFALGLLIFVVLVLFYGVIAIHDIPYEIAKSREHPHQDAIHYAGWVSLFTLHVLWPFLWIWATLWRKERGWGFHRLEEEQHDLHHRLEQLIDQVNVLQTQVDKLSSPNLPEAQTKATPSSDAQEKEQ
ncbi:DUF3302 domain-containing protein [Vibrio taketomensis]|uniref:DUF3302 domain-containing protein n=1 Tax=Vibrio taketomensis TaxID=2572923 RepID=UPI00138A61EC|nr:DUF3302 domain-containing protein [Vibrio taketomensis]